ncbi:MAG: DUF1624 domain-containing protein [Myxococcales bacterium]|nr:DUF1624 domain-containing protein [Myxococcales bacterium]MCB9709502.1 DUF1624 domain-containing protein [Myxococcales bacterium]
MKSHRKDYIDVLRGMAVGSMLIWHTASSWVVPAAHTGLAWSLLRSIGGMGAPLFLLLAGVSIALKPNRFISPGIDMGLVHRGLQIMLLGYLLRLQMWLIDSSALFHPVGWQCYVPLLLGFAAAWQTLAQWRALHQQRISLIQSARLLGWASLALLSLWVGYARVAQLFPARWNGLLRVDVLQIIGVSLVLVAVLITYVRRPMVWIALAVMVTLLAWPLAHVLPGPFPAPLAAYFARWPLHGERQMAMFPLFPWFAYLLVGLTAGRWIQSKSTSSALLWLAPLGLLGAYLTGETRMLAHDLMTGVLALTHTLRVSYRVFVATALTAGAYGASRWARALAMPLRMYGQTSLLIYWVHLEFAFGKAARLFRPCESLGEWAVKLAALALLMLGVSYARLKYISSRLYSPATSR